MKLLVRRHGPRSRLDALLVAMRCGTCRGRPVEAEWMEHAAAGAVGGGYDAARRVQDA